MARWEVRLRLPTFPTKVDAERYARAEYGAAVLEVISVANEEIAQGEREGHVRNRRRGWLDKDDEDGGA